MAGGEIPVRKAAGRSPLRSLGLMVLFVFAAIAVLPTAIVVAVGLVPMVVTLVIDDLPGRYLARTVSGMATAALIPFVGRLWEAGHTLRAAMALVSDVYSWFAIYAAVGAGWLMFLGFPSLVAELRAFNGQRRIARLRKQQDELVAEWGDAIAGAPDAEAPPADAPARPPTPSQPAPSAPG